MKIQIFKKKTQETIQACTQPRNNNFDVLFNLDYENLIQFHKKNKNIITVVGAKKIIKVPYGVCKIQSKNIQIELGGDTIMHYTMNYIPYLLPKRETHYQLSTYLH